MKEFSSQDILAALKKNLSEKFPATPPAGSDVPAEKQMHFFKPAFGTPADSPEKDFFFLVVGIDGDRCEVIPGSLDGLMASPADVVLPPSATGRYAYLAVDLAMTVPSSSLGKFFAVADDALYQRILASRLFSGSSAAEEIRPLPHALPYISRHDPRIAYRQNLVRAVKKIRCAEPPFKTGWIHAAAVCRFPFWSVAASLFIVGAVAVYFLAGEGSRRKEADRSENFIACAPSGVSRGKEDAGIILSPQATMLSSTPTVAVGGKSGEKYLVEIIDLDDGQTIVKHEISGGESVPWARWSDRELKRDTAYRIVLRDREKTCARRDFWLLDAAPELKGTPLEKAKILYRYGCYAEAYLLLSPLYEKNADDPDFRTLFESCVQKLDLK